MSWTNERCLSKFTFQYLFNYLNTIEGWLDDDTISQTPISQCAVSLLQDFYSNPAIIEFKPEHVAIAILVLTFQIFGLKIPGVDDADNWYKAFCPDLDLETVWEIMDQMLRVYELEQN